MDFRHDRSHEGDQQSPRASGGFLLHLQQVVASVDQVANPANGPLVRQQPHFGAHQVEQVKFAFGQLGAVG